MNNKGKIIYLNGVTSSGKTTIVNALRQKRDFDFYYLSDDIFEDNIIDIEYGSPGYWTKLSEAVFLMYKTAKLFSDNGQTVIIDSMLIEREEFYPHYQRMLETFKNSPLITVLVDCPLDICRQRNIARPDRFEYQSHEQAKAMAQNVQYDLMLDTSVLTAEGCAKLITNLL